MLPLRLPTTYFLTSQSNFCIFESETLADPSRKAPILDGLEVELVPQHQILLKYYV